MKEFVKRYEIMCENARVDANPAMPDFVGDHWRVKLARTGSPITMALVYSKGRGHKGAPPTVQEVLECLRADADGADAEFETWADNFGLDTDSRQAERSYRATCRQTARLRKFLGEDFDEFMQLEEI